MSRQQIDLPSTAETNRTDFERMYNDLKDPEKREEAKQKNERAKRIEDRKKDTGYEY